MMEEKDDYGEIWKSHSRCLKNLKPSCEECRDVGLCKQEYKYEMMAYQIMRKEEGEISVEFNSWLQQEFKNIDQSLISCGTVPFKLYEYFSKKKTIKK
jgi:hypothetical protein